MSSDQYLRIGGMTLALRSSDAAIEWRWSAPVLRFLGEPGSPDLLLDVSIAPPRPVEGELLFESGGIWRMYRDTAGYRIDCRAPLFGDAPYRSATIDSSWSRGVLTITPEAAAHGIPPLEYPLDELLFATLLAQGRGIELHCCGLIDSDGRGVLFVGASGAGKTTTARLWETTARAILSDDRIILREEEGRMQMYGTPWHGEAELSVPESVPLSAVYLLQQAPRNEVRPLSPGDAVARLFGCTFPPFHDPAALSFGLSFLERVVRAVPVRLLEFRNDRSAVRTVLESLRA